MTHRTWLLLTQVLGETMDYWSRSTNEVIFLVAQPSYPSNRGMGQQTWSAPNLSLVWWSNWIISALLQVLCICTGKMEMKFTYTSSQRRLWRQSNGSRRTKNHGFPNSPNQAPSCNWSEELLGRPNGSQRTILVTNKVNKVEVIMDHTWRPCNMAYMEPLLL